LPAVDEDLRVSGEAVFDSITFLDMIRMFLLTKKRLKHESDHVNARPLVDPKIHGHPTRKPACRFASQALCLHSIAAN
jgi:hypothetical protein